MCQSAQETSLLTMFDTDTWEPVHLPASIPGMVHAPAFLADDTLVWYERGWIVARDPENFALVWSRRAPDEGTKSLHPVAGGDLVVWQWAYGQASVLDAGNGKQLGIFGERDESIPEPHIDRIQAELAYREKDHEIHVFPGAGHGFFCEEQPSHYPEAAADAWERPLRWPAKQLR